MKPPKEARIDEVKPRGQSWQALPRQLTWRQLHWPRHALLLSTLDRVHYVDHGDYTIAELTTAENTTKR